MQDVFCLFDDVMQVLNINSVPTMDLNSVKTDIRIGATLNLSTGKVHIKVALIWRMNGNLFNLWNFFWTSGTPQRSGISCVIGQSYSKKAVM